MEWRYRQKEALLEREEWNKVLNRGMDGRYGRKGSTKAIRKERCIGRGREA